MIERDGYVIGSSPWVRGTHQAKYEIEKNWRFIPVGTGNTTYGHLTAGSNAVHPRGYGEHLKSV